MATPRRRASRTGTRRGTSLALVVLLLCNLLAGGAGHFGGATAEAQAGAIAICSADGGIRQVLPDGTPVPDAPARGGQDCPLCAGCIHACGAPCAQPAAASLALGPAYRPAGPGFAARPETPVFRVYYRPRPPGQAPPRLPT